MILLVGGRKAMLHVEYGKLTAYGVEVECVDIIYRAFPDSIEDILKLLNTRRIPIHRIDHLT